MKTLRQKLLVSLVVAFMACVSLFCAFSFQTAKAEVNADLFTIEEGASVAIQKDGLRFRVKMGANVYESVVDDAITVYVAPKTVLDTVTDGNYAGLEKKVDFTFKKTDIYQRGDYYYANAVLTNLDAANNQAITSSQYDLEFGAVAVMGEQVTDVVTATQYDTLQKAVISPADEDNAFANAILDAENSPYKNWFGKADHPIVIDTEEKYTDFASKGVETTAVFKVYNKFDFDKADFSANSIYVHYVNFYDKDTLLETVEVVEGNEAVCTVKADKYASVEVMNGYIRGYLNQGNWTYTRGGSDIADLTNVTNNVDVWVNWGSMMQLQNEYLADLRASEPDTIFSFDTELGVCQGFNAGGASAPYETKTYDTTVKAPGQKGSTKFTWTNDSKSTVYLSYTSGLLASWQNAEVPAFDFSKYDDTNDYLVMDIYPDYPDTVDHLWIRMKSTPGCAVRNKTWGKIIVPLSSVTAGTYFWIDYRNTDGGSVATAGSIYLGKGVVMTASEVTTLTSTSTYTLGDMQMAGAEHYNWGGTANNGIFTQSYYGKASIINNELYYCDHNSNQGDRGMFLTFEELQTGKIYIVSKGLDTGLTNAQMFSDTTVSSSTHKGTPGAVYEGYTADGYKVYSFNFGSNQIKMIKLRTYGYMNAVWIKSISNTLPEGTIVPAA